MLPEFVVNYIMPAALAALGWFARMLYTDVKSLADEVKQIQIHYATRSDLQMFRDEMRANFQEVKELIKEQSK